MGAGKDVEELEKEIPRTELSVLRPWRYGNSSVREASRAMKTQRSWRFRISELRCM